MRRILALSILLLTGCAANPADNAPAARVETPAPAATAPAPPAPGETPAAAPQVQGQVYAIEPGNSKVDWEGSKVTRSHLGGFKSFSGEIGLVDQDPTKSTVRIEIDVDTLFSDDEKLTGHLKSPDFFDVQAHPTATFSSTSIQKAGEGYEVTGDLTMHGVTRRITFPATIAVEPNAVKAKAEFHIKRKDFGIVYPGKPDDLIRDEVVLRLDVNAQPQVTGG